MSKALFGVIIFASVFVIIIGVVVFRFFYRLYTRIKNTKKAMEDALYNHQRKDYTGRRAQQYHYDDSKKQHRSTGPLNEAAQDAQPRRTQTQSGEVIIDHRHQERENKKIFTEDDGEYVDFSEES